MGAIKDVGAKVIDDFSSIQLAIAAAPDGGTVRVNAGGVANEYAEDLTINNKRVTMIGTLPRQGVRVTGTGGAAPALLVTGTGGVTLVNMYFENQGTSASYIVEANVDQDWIDSVIVNAHSVTACMQAQWVRNCCLYDGTVGLYSSCGGTLMALHTTCVNMLTSGIGAGATDGFYQACLCYNCNGASFLVGQADLCQYNASDDATPPGPMNRPGLLLAEIAFQNYAGKNFLLNQATSRAWFQGAQNLPDDGLNVRRLRVAKLNRVYPGYYDAFPGAPVWASGASQIREF